MTRLEPGTNTRTSSGHANPRMDGDAPLASGVSEQVRRSREGRSREGGLGASSPLRSVHVDPVPPAPQGCRGGRGHRRQSRHGHIVRPEEPSPRSAARRSVGASLGAVGLPASPGLRSEGSNPPVCPPRKRGVVGRRQGSPAPRAQPRTRGLARYGLHRSHRTPTSTERTHGPPGPREGPGGQQPPVAASAARRWRRRDDGCDAPGREAQESNGHGPPATVGHRNGCSYGARP